jgi:hypothetical protein
MAQRRGVSITLSRNFATEEFVNTLLQLEIHPAQFFDELKILEQADDGQLKVALSRLLDSGVDLGRAIEILLPQLPEAEK